MSDTEQTTTKKRRGTKPGSKRGPYKRGSAKTRARVETLSALGLGPDERPERVRALAAALEAESLLSKPQARRTSCEVVAGLAVLLDASLQAHSAGTLSTDEAGKLSSLGSLINKMLTTTGLDHKINAGDCRACLGIGEIDGKSCKSCDGTGEEPV